MQRIGVHTYIHTYVRTKKILILREGKVLRKRSKGSCEENPLGRETNYGLSFQFTTKLNYYMPPRFLYRQSWAKCALYVILMYDITSACHFSTILVPRLPDCQMCQIINTHLDIMIFIFNVVGYPCMNCKEYIHTF